MWAGPKPMEHITAMANFFTDNEDLQYYMNKGIDWGPIIETVERGDTSVFANDDESS